MHVYMYMYSIWNLSGGNLRILFHELSFFSIICISVSFQLSFSFLKDFVFIYTTVIVNKQLILFRFSHKTEYQRFICHLTWKTSNFVVLTPKIQVPGPLAGRLGLEVVWLSWDSPSWTLTTPTHCGPQLLKKPSTRFVSSSPQCLKSLYRPSPYRRHPPEEGSASSSRTLASS